MEHPSIDQARANRIADLLIPLNLLDDYRVAIESDPSDDRRRFACYWADRETQEKKIFISVERLPNPLQRVAAFRDYDPDIDPPVHEVTRTTPGEYAFIKTNTDSIYAIKDDCAIFLGLPEKYSAIHYIDLAFSILQTIGCVESETD